MNTHALYRQHRLEQLRAMLEQYPDNAQLREEVARMVGIHERLEHLEEQLYELTGSYE